MNIVVTGAGGFVGRELVVRLAGAGHTVVALARTPGAAVSPGVRSEIVDLAAAAAEHTLFRTVEKMDAVVHLAVLKAAHDSSNVEAYCDNLRAAANVARATVRAQVPRLVFLSSAHVSGTVTRGTPLSERSPLVPGDGYARSKIESERELAEITGGTGTKLVVIRPPLVYGPGQGGSMRRLAEAVMHGLPLPLARVNGNRRDLIGVTNLAHFIEVCCRHAEAGGETFVVRDGVPVSTRGLIEAFATAAGRPPRWVPVPVSWLSGAARLAGLRRTAERLLGSYEIDDSKARRMLGWQAPHAFAYDIGRLVASLQTVQDRVQASSA